MLRHGTRMPIFALLALSACLIAACAPPARETHVSGLERSLAVPTVWASGNGGVLPVSYLEGLQVDATHQLTAVERRRLAELVSKAHEDSVRLYRQSYFFRADTPLGQLIERNFPETRHLKKEGGNFYLGDLAAHLTSAVGGKSR